MYRTLTTLALLSLPAAAAAQQEHGQGPVEPGPVQLKDLNLGTYWFGAKTDLDALRGKVVLVEIWGS